MHCTAVSSPSLKHIQIQIKNTNQQHEHHERKTNPLQSNSRTDSVHVTGILYLDIHKYSSSVREIWQIYGTFFALFLRDRKSNSTQPCTINPRLAWMVQECPTLICAFGFFVTGKEEATGSLANRILLGMFILHYVNRTLIYPFLIRGSKRVPIATVLLAFAFCSVNGYVQCRYLTQFRVYDESWLADARFLIGIVMFFFGFAVNNHSDHVLRNLRKPGETGYKIPYGGMFEYVSGANFLGEILEWFGFAIANWSYPAFAFALCMFHSTNSFIVSLTLSTKDNTNNTLTKMKQTYNRYCIQHRTSSYSTPCVV